MTAHTNLRLLCNKLGAVMIIMAWSLDHHASIPSAGWCFNGTVQYGASPMPADTLSQIFQSAMLIRGYGVVSSGLAANHAWGGRGFTSPDPDSAIRAGQYLIITLVINSDSFPYLSHMMPYNIRRSATGPNKGMWQYSINQQTYRALSDSIIIGSNTTATGNPQQSLSLHNIATQNPPLKKGDTLRLRYVLWGATASNGACYFNSTQQHFDLLITFSNPLQWHPSSSNTSTASPNLIWSDSTNWRSTNALNSIPNPNNSAILDSNQSRITLPDSAFANLIHIKRSPFEFLPNPNSMVFSNWKSDSAQYLYFFDSLATYNQTLTLRGNFWADPNGSIQMNTMQGSHLSRLNLATFNSSTTLFEPPVYIRGKGLASIAATGSGSNTMQIQAPVYGNGSRLFVGSTGNNTLILNNINNPNAPLRIAAGLTGGTGTVIITGSQNQWSDTEFNNASDGQLILMGGDNRLPSQTTLLFGVNSNLGNSTLDLNGNNQEVAQIGNLINEGGLITNNRRHSLSVLTLSGNDTLRVFSGSLADGGGQIGLYRKGHGTTTLSRQCNHTGPTVISSGKLILDGPDSGTISPQSTLILKNGILHLRNNQSTDSLFLIDGTLYLDSGATLTINQSLFLQNTAILGSGKIQYKNGASLVYGHTVSRQTGCEWPEDSVPYSVVINTHDTVSVVLSQAKKVAHTIELKKGSLNLNGHNFYCQRIHGGSPNETIRIASQEQVFVMADSTPVFIPLKKQYFNPITIAYQNPEPIQIGVTLMDSVLENGMQGNPITGSKAQVTWLVTSQDLILGKGIDIHLEWNQEQETDTVYSPIVHALNSHNNWRPIISSIEGRKANIYDYKGPLLAFCVIDAAHILPLCSMHVALKKDKHVHEMMLNGLFAAATSGEKTEAITKADLELLAALIYEHGIQKTVYRTPLTLYPDGTFTHSMVLATEKAHTLALYFTNSLGDTLCKSTHKLSQQIPAQEPTIYPIPANGHFNLSCAPTSLLKSCKVYAAHGAKPKELQASPSKLTNPHQIEYRFDIKDLVPGLYTVVFEYESHVSHHKLIIY